MYIEYIFALKRFKISATPRVPDLRERCQHMHGKATVSQIVSSKLILIYVKLSNFNSILLPLARDAEGNVNLKGEHFERGVAGIGKLDPEMYRSISLDRWRNCKHSRLNELNERYMMALFGKEEPIH